MRCYAQTADLGVVLAPSQQESRCDNLKVAGPVVKHDGKQWLMWYYCQGSTTCFKGGLPLGDIGLATSPDGLTWTRTEGPLEGGAVLSPRWDDGTAFDSAMLGISCVLRVQDEWWMYYSGGVQAGSPLKATSPVGGFPMRAGLARSADGINWDRVQGDGPGGSILDIGGEGEHDERYIGWPSVVQLEGGSFLMIYHSAIFKTTEAGGFAADFALARAVSEDGVHWTKTGLCNITGRDTTDAAFDVDGLGTRDVVALPGGELLMHAEGVDAQGQHNIAALRSSDVGQTWNICQGGKAILSAGEGANVGTACVVRPRGETGDDWWLYCVKTKRKEGGGADFSIGLAQSSTGPEGPFTWYQA